MRIDDKTDGLIKIKDFEFYYSWSGSLTSIPALRDKGFLIVDLDYPLVVSGRIYCYGFKSKNSIIVADQFVSNGNVQIDEGDLKVLRNFVIDGKVFVKNEIFVGGDIKSSCFGSPNYKKITNIKCTKLSCKGDVSINGMLIVKEGCKISGKLEDRFSLASGKSDKIWFPSK